MKSWILSALLAVASGHAIALGHLSQLEIIDRDSNRVVPVHYSGGRHYIAGSPGSKYAIRLRNRAGIDLLAVVSVDGVNVVSGETASPDQGGYILAPGQLFDIKGWRKSLDHVAQFYFSRVDDSYAARTGRRENVGVIGVALFKRKSVPQLSGDLRLREEAPADAARRAPEPAAGKATEQAIGTGHGRPETSVVRYAEFERASENPAETITLYYDSYDNLVARGVIPATQHLPQPFPGGFVPDPPRS